MPKKATVVKLFSEEHANTVFVALGTQLGSRCRNSSDFEIHLNTHTCLLFEVVDTSQKTIDVKIFCENRKAATAVIFRS